MPAETKNTNGDAQKDKSSGWIPDPSPKLDNSSTSETTNDIAETTQDEKTSSPPSEQLPKRNNPMPPNPAPITPSEERTWAMLAHLSVLLNLVTGFLGGIAAIIIYFVYKDRSRLIAYHAMQSFIFQTITWLGAGMLAGLFIGFGSALAILIIPLLCLIPGFLFLLLIPVSLIYGIIGGVKVNNGEDFRYWQVGDWVRDILEPKQIPMP